MSMPFFETWWQGIAFGVVTTVVMLVIANCFHGMWKKYEDTPQKKSTSSCDAHH